MSIKSFVLNKCASASPSALPANSGLKYDQFNGGANPGCAGDTTDYAGGTTQGKTACCASGCAGCTTGGRCSCLHGNGVLSSNILI